METSRSCLLPSALKTKTIRITSSSLIKFYRCLISNNGRHLIYKSLKIRHVPRPIHEELRSITPNNWVYGVELLSSSDSAEHVTTTSDIARMQHLELTGECWAIGDVTNNDHYLAQIIASSVFMKRVLLC